MLRGTISGSGSLGGTLHGGASMGGTLASGGRYWPPYGGAVEVVPSRSAQVLATAGTHLESDITVHPIPSNYGLVEWNGAVLTVS